MEHEVLDFYILIGGFLVVSVIITYLIKRFTKFDTYFIITIIKTKRPLWIFDKLAVIGKPLDWLTEIGLILGFGSLAVDYLYGRKLPTLKRIALFFTSSIFLMIVFLGFDLLLRNSFSQGPFSKDVFVPMTIFFGLTGFAGFIILFLAIHALTIIFNFFSGQNSCPGVAPILPGIDVPNVPISIPFHAWIPLFFVLVIHELMHGVVARKEKIKVKSTGILLLGFLPIGGFVEPDEKQLLAADDRKQLHVFAAGVITNFIGFMGTIVFLLVIGVVIAATVGPWAEDIRNESVLHVGISDVFESVEFCRNDYESTAFGVLEAGMIIKEINGKEVNHFADVTNEISATRHQPITLTVEQDEIISDLTISPNELGSFGFSLENIPNEEFNPPDEYNTFIFVIGIIFEFASWFLIFNLLLALANYLPIPFFDGGKMAVIMLTPYLSFLGKNKIDTQKVIMKFFVVFLLILIIINALPLFF